MNFNLPKTTTPASTPIPARPSTPAQAPTPAKDPMHGTLLDFMNPKGANILKRTQDFSKWVQGRQNHDLWPYSRTHTSPPLTTCTIADVTGEKYAGVNFASQDYLSLANHPKVKKAAVSAIESYGVHSAGSSALMGNTALSVKLEGVISDLLCMEHTVLYPTGWAAGYGVVTGLIHKGDHLVMDQLSHACLQAGAMAATTNVRRFRHNDIEHLRSRLETIRAKDQDHGILVVTEGLFSMDSDSPNIEAMQALCKEHNATLMVDVAHDLGSMGPGGTGAIGTQKMLGKVDIVMGSFSKTFGSNGGFVVSNLKSVSDFLRFYSSPQTFSNALSPIQAAVALKAFDIVRSTEGSKRREALMNNINLLKSELATRGFTTLGDPSPIVPVLCGSEQVVRVTGKLLKKMGILANTVEFPAVAKGAARIRLQVMADHSSEEIIAVATGIAAAVHEARKQLGEE